MSRKRPKAGGGSRGKAGGKAAGSPTNAGPSAPPIIVGGCPRSGTTLLRMMLDAHPRIACGPEMKIGNLIASHCARMLQIHGGTLEGEYGLSADDVARSFGDQWIALLEPHRQRAGKPRIAEKTPQNIHGFSLFARMLPTSPLVHVVRDGRDVVHSLLRQRWMDPATGKPLAYCSQIDEAAKYWAMCIRDGRTARQVAGDRYIEVRYEALVEDPEATMKTLLSSLGEPWNPSVLEFHRAGGALPASERGSHGDDLSKPVYRSAVGRWRTDWTDEQVATVQQYAGARLRELRYLTDED